MRRRVGVSKAMRGVYTIKADFRGGDSVKVAGVVTVRVDIYRNFGRKNEDCKSIALQLREKKGTITVGRIKF